MSYPIQVRDFDIPVTVNSAATFTAGFTVAVAAPTRGEILAVYLTPIDGTALTGSAVLTLTVANVAGATLTCGAASAGFATGTTALLGNTLSARQFVNEGEVIKAVLATGLTGATNAVVTFIIRGRSI